MARRKKRRPGKLTAERKKGVGRTSSIKKREKRGSSRIRRTLPVLRAGRHICRWLSPGTDRPGRTNRVSTGRSQKTRHGRAGGRAVASVSCCVAPYHAARIPEGGGGGTHVGNGDCPRVQSLLLRGNTDPCDGIQNQLTLMLSGSMASQSMLAAFLTRSSMMALTTCFGSPTNQESGWNGNTAKHCGRRGGPKLGNQRVRSLKDHTKRGGGSRTFPPVVGDTR